MPPWSVAEGQGPWSRRCNWRGCCRTSTMDKCQCTEQRARGDLNGCTSQSIGPEWSEYRLNRDWEHPEDLCSLRPGDSILDRVPRFAYFRSLTSSQLSYLILQVL